MSSPIDSNENSTENDDSKKEHDKAIAGIRIIELIGEKVATGVIPGSKILAAINQIITFFKLLPDEWKSRARDIFKKLWKREQITFSTNPSEVKAAYDMEFEDERISKLYSIVSPEKKKAMRMGKRINDFNKKGLHDKAEEYKQKTKEKFGDWGIKIVNMMDSGDIQLILDDINDLPNEREKEEFDKWVSEYRDIVSFISPADLENKTELKQEISDLAQRTPKDFIILHMMGSSEEVAELINFNQNEVVNEILKCEECLTSSSELGFHDTVRIEIQF